MASDKEEKDLIKKRASYKGRLTAFWNFLRDLGDTLNPLQVNELQLRIGKIENLYQQYDEVQLKLECMVEDISSQITERSDFESTYYQTLSKAQHLLAKNTETNKVQVEALGSEHSSRSHCNNRPVKLPTIVLPKYSGSYDNWLEFRDTFSSLIHSNEDIDNINKFHYLRASLEGSAAVVIQSIGFSAINYPVAWKLLCERFDNTRLLIQNHVSALFNIDAIKSESSVSLKRLIDQVNKNLRALESLNEPTTHWDTLLIHLASLKLDQKTFREWEECKGRFDKNHKITLSNFFEFMRNRADLLETLEMCRNNKGQQSTSMSNTKLKTLISVTNPRVQAETSLKPLAKSCPTCSGDHALYNCAQFLAFSPDKRLELIPRYKICFNCFRSGHYANNCKKNGCKICKRKHNTLLHVADKPTVSQVCTTDDSNKNVPVPSTNSSPAGVALTTCMHAPLGTEQDVLLSTALVKVLDRHGQPHIVRALLDCGSSSCIMTQELSNELDLPFFDVDKPIYGINKTQTRTSGVCRIEMQSLSEDFSRNLLCYVLPAITDKIPCRRINVNHFNIPINLKLADPHFNKSSDVKLVIGSNVFWDLLGSQKINLGDNQPVLWETRLGWIVSGPVSGFEPNSLLCNFTKIYTDSDDPKIDEGQNLLSRFWQVEEVEFKSSFSRDELLCEEHFLKHTTRLANGRFCVRLPLKQSPKVLGDSLARSKQCLVSLERKFKSNPKFHQMYVDFMSEYISMGHMTECPIYSNATTYFIPHHGVMRESSSTTKLRVVFNASMPSTSQVSCNDIQLVGPTVQDDLLSILIRFRQHKYVLAADIEKMYRQVIVHPADRHLQQIVWRNNPSEPMKSYQLNTVSYGTASAPFLATRCIKQIGIDCKDSTISEIIQHDMYVDDLLTGDNTIDGILEIKRKITDTLASACMPLRKWRSNCSDLVQKRSFEQNLASVDLNIGNEHNKTLGLGWLTSSDELFFSIKYPLPTDLTKRGMLAVIGKIFDPMGLLSPCVVTVKILMQKLWLLKLSWDDQLPSDILNSWSEILESLPSLNKVRIPRLIICDAFKTLEFHIFSDASVSAFGACLYVRSTNAHGETLVRLLMAKSRVAPIKPLTIPRLELCGALVGVRLYQKAIASLRLKVGEITFWTDSTIVLGWLKMHPSKLQPFVRNRVGEIMEHTSDCNWRHVPSDQNPADIISRGIKMNEIQSSNFWWSGPQYLSKNKTQWPDEHYAIPNVEILPECAAEVSLHAFVAEANNFINFNNFSNLLRLKRSIAYMLRFISICKKQSLTNNSIITNDELQNALILIIRQSQRESFYEYGLLINNKPIPRRSALCKFNVFLDDNKLLRVGGRLRNSSFCYDKKHPILIQSTHHFTKLLFKSEHNRLMHAGPQLLLATIRENYWPIGGRNLAKSTYHQCVRCTRMKGKVIEPIMGNLPQSRLNPGGYPFECVGVDYAGPISCVSRQGRGCKLIKVYIAVFVCFTTKALHTELVGDLTSNNFLSALRRFMSRRGKPRDIYSDNGTSFVGAFKEIGRFLQTNCNSLAETTANEGITCHFIPPYSPHFGGLWEAGVKSVKYHLLRVLGNCRLTYEELNTVLVQIEAILNSRPISTISSDPNDFTPLTPGHFLIGRPLVALPAPDLQATSMNHLTRYQKIEQLRQHFWSRWSKEYVGELQQRIKWRHNQDSLKINTLVVVKEDHLPPMKWRLGRIIAVHSGSDSVHRVADIMTSNGVIRRSFNRICPLINSPLEDKASKTREHVQTN